MNDRKAYAIGNRKMPSAPFVTGLREGPVARWLVGLTSATKATLSAYDVEAMADQLADWMVNDLEMESLRFERGDEPEVIE